MQKSIGNTITYYQTIGSEKVNLVLLHGWGCDWQIWQPIIQQLSLKFKLIIPDLPSFGKSVLSDKAWDSRQYAKWLDQFIKAVAPQKKYILVGHSFGGKIAAVFAATHQNKIKNLVLIDSAGIPFQLTTKDKIQQKLANFIPESVKIAIPSGLKLKLLNILGASTDHINLTAQQRAIFKKIVREDISPQLKKIKVATTLIWGKNDQDTPLDQARKFNKLIKNSQLKTLNTGHFPFIEKPNQVLEIINAL